MYSDTLIHLARLNFPLLLKIEAKFEEIIRAGIQNAANQANNFLPSRYQFPAMERVQR